MPFLLGFLGLLALVGLLYWRLRLAREAAGELIEAGPGVRAAARRLGVRRRGDVHPADAVEDPRLAAVGAALAVAGMDGPHSQAELTAAAAECRSRFGVDADEAGDMVALGRWLAGECATPEDAVRRLGRVVRKHAFDAGEELLEMVRTVTTADAPDADGMGERETRAHNQLADIFGLR